MRVSYVALPILAFILLSASSCDYVKQAEFDAYKTNVDDFNHKVESWAREIDKWVQDAEEVDAEGNTVTISGAATFLKYDLLPELCELIEAPKPDWCTDPSGPPPPDGPECDFDSCGEN